eukprot:TRINITY_DN2416_c0_g2_i2.p1 TRINITY_DN2416_c0_g2~~TRINITY_DN2416_c0_g2_i2.p1  ORF type:complete len:363 (-),score=54.95 TRINITY_DN2416_c0_g2_i2:34-1122(-)
MQGSGRGARCDDLDLHLPQPPSAEPTSAYGRRRSYDGTSSAQPAPFRPKTTPSHPNTPPTDCRLAINSRYSNVRDEYRYFGTTHTPRDARLSTAPGSLRHRAMTRSDIGVTGDAAGLYTYHAGVSRGPSVHSTPRPDMVQTERSASTRRYFFPEHVNVECTAHKGNPFYRHFDVVLGSEENNPQADALNYKAGARPHESFYYRDFTMRELEHFSANREKASLHIEQHELRDWLVTAKPRTAMDAGPMLVLCQNLLVSLLEDKSIVFAERLEAANAEHEAELGQMSEKIAQLEAALEACQAERRVAHKDTAHCKSKLARKQEHLAELEKRMEHTNELVKVCLLYTSDAADEEDSVDLGGRRNI